MHSSSALHTVLVHAVMQVPQMKTVTFCQASAHAVPIQMGGTAHSVWVGRLGFPGSRSAHWSNHWDNALPREGKEESQ